MKKKVMLLSLLIGFLISCKSSDTTTSKPECPDVNTDTDVEFILSVSLNDCFKGKNQTIFVESSDKELESIYAIGAQFSYRKYSNGAYKKVKISEFKLKKLYGKDKMISSVELIQSNSKKPHIIKITTRTLPWEEVGSVEHTAELTINKLKPNEYFRVEVIDEKEIGYTGPRICENYIGSLAK